MPYHILAFQVLAGACAIFRGYDSEGRSVPTKVAAFVRMRTGANQGDSSRGSSLDSCTPGLYEYRVFVGGNERSGYVNLERVPGLVVLHGEQPVLRADTGEVAHIDYKASVRPGVSGRVRGAIELAQLWIRIQSVINPLLYYDTAVGADGSFEVSRLASGHYVVLVFRDGTPIHTRLLRIQNARSILEIALEPPSGPMKER